MKKLIVIRHLESGKNDFPIPDSEEVFWQVLQKRIDPKELGSCVFLSSNAARTFGTLFFFASYAKRYNFTITAKNCLYCKDENTLEDFEKIYQLIQDESENTDTVVICTHAEYTGGLVDYFKDRNANKELRKDYVAGRCIGKGQIIIYDIEKNTTVLVGPTDTDIADFPEYQSL
jgi:hypothetical protein